MYRVACNNMAQGVREVTIKRGFDPREFPLIPAGGAGPIHACLICSELEIPLQIVPREVLGAVRLRHADVRAAATTSCAPSSSRLEGSTGRAWRRWSTTMSAEGARAARRRAHRRRAAPRRAAARLPLHQAVPRGVGAGAAGRRSRARDAAAIAARLPRRAPCACTAIRWRPRARRWRSSTCALQAIGATDKPRLPQRGAGRRRRRRAALKGRRNVYIARARRVRRRCRSTTATACAAATASPARR